MPGFYVLLDRTDVAGYSCSSDFFLPECCKQRKVGLSQGTRCGLIPYYNNCVRSLTIILLVSKSVALKKKNSREPCTTLTFTRKRLFDTLSASKQDIENDPCFERNTLSTDKSDLANSLQDMLQSTPYHPVPDDTSLSTDVTKECLDSKGKK